MGGRQAFRTRNQPWLPTELQEEAKHVQESSKPSLFVYLGFFFPQAGDVHSRLWNDDSIKEKQHTATTPRKPLQGYVSYI